MIEIADELGLSEANVKNILHRAKKKLRGVMEKMEDYSFAA
jgi:DNA-directed RNA polymerase specialized sigma24 family protein